MSAKSESQAMTPQQREYNDRVVAALARPSTLGAAVAELHPDFDEERRTAVVNAILSGCQIYLYRDSAGEHLVHLDPVRRLVARRVR